MRTNKTLLITGLAVLVIFASCKKWVDDLDQSPNSAVDAPLTALMTGALVGMIQPVEGEDARLAAMWSRQFTGSDRQYSAFNGYTINAENFDWSGYYYSAAMQARLVEEKAEAEGNSFYSGVAKIVQALAYGSATALYGDVPFSQANNLDEFPDPAYDAQLDVYAGVQQLLDDAIVELSTGSGTDVGGVDFYYGGDASKWISAAYSLKARYYLHVRNYGEAINAANLGIMSSDDDWLIPHGTDYNQDMNFYYSFGTQDRQGYLTANGAYLPQLLDNTTAINRENAKTDESKRFAFIYTKDTTGVLTYDLNYSGYWASARSFPVINAVETYLILAEAELRGGSGSTAALNALNEVRSINNLNVNLSDGGDFTAYDISDFNAGGIEDNGQGSADDNLLYEILEEKYVSLVGQQEVFNDVKRTDNFLGLSPTNGSQLPERFLYPQEEVDANSQTPKPIPGIFVPTPVNQ